MNPALVPVVVVAASMLLALVVIALWSSWALRRHRDETPYLCRGCAGERATVRLCVDCKWYAALDGLSYCEPCKQERIAAGTAQVDAAIARGEW